jgi:hypothetical protein
MARRARKRTAPTESIDRQLEMMTCRISPFYFIHTYCQIYEGDEQGGHWIPFHPWAAQADAIESMYRNQKSVALKARQLGFTWIAAALGLHQMIFWPEATVLLFSKRDDEAMELLSFRLGGLFNRLPDWLKPKIASDNAHALTFTNGSRAMAFPTNAGRSYTATMAVIDEADYVPDLVRLLDNVQPTVDHGGKLILISTVDKTKPMSAFKQIYRGAKASANGYVPIFCGWSVRPERNAAWYTAKKAEIKSRDGSLDQLWEQYPETDAEALAAATFDKRIPAAWLQQCFVEIRTVPEEDFHVPSVPALKVWRMPVRGRRYVMGADTAEGNPTSDDSSCHVLDRDTGEEVAEFTGKFEPAVFASYIGIVGRWYEHAAVMVERNNHGHAVILGLQGEGLALLNGHDGHVGWLSSGKGKALLYAACADAFRNRETTLHSFETFVQLGSIEGNTLRAPESMPDDRADSYALAIAGVVTMAGGQIIVPALQRGESLIAGAPAGVWTAASRIEDEDADLDDDEGAMFPRF